MLCAKHCVLETPWRAEINQVVGITRAKSLWQKGGWPVRRTERMVTWLEQRGCWLHAVGGGWHCGKAADRHAPWAEL